jgi:MoaA/NifB/PqqE/SkfB family radical SAM enzyme
LEIHIVDHCNLNCAYCTHYSPLTKEKFVDTVQYENDFKRLSKLGADKVRRVRLLGGEPLLHDKLPTLTRIARECFLKSEIQVVTNGILLPKQSDEFWDVCSKHNIEIYISSYPINLDYELIKSLAKKHKIKLIYHDNDNSVDRLQMAKYVLDIDGQQNLREAFRICTAANGTCTNLRDGKLYQCPTSAYISVFNEYFSRNLELSEKDYIDIYKVNSMDEIFEFLRRPVPFCRFCVNNYAAFPWKTSKKEISEWVAVKE